MFSQAKALIKAALAAPRRYRRQRELQTTRRLITRHELRASLEAFGIVAGDIVMLHSSLKNIGYVEGGPEAVLQSLIDAVGPSGTLVVPTYWLPGGTILATCQLPDYVFDPRRHGSHLGRLPSTFLQMPGIERSIHPTHSVSARGAAARYVVEHHHLAPSILGAGSPWDRCHELNAKVLGLGISMGPVTFYHLLEDRMGDAFPVPVRMKQACLLPCLDWSGDTVLVPVAPYHPAFMKARIDAPPRDDLRDYFRAEFERAGLVHSGRVGDADSWFIPAQAFYAHLHRLMQEGITIYSSPEQLAARPLDQHRKTPA